MKKLLTLLLFPIVLLSCNNTTETKNKEDKIAFDTSVAVDFVNQYIMNIEKGGDLNAWIENNPSLTPKFKKAYQVFLSNEEEGVPSGDPILDAQDYPTEGFQIKEIDEEHKVVIVEGVNWEEFTLNIRLELVDGKTLVDACGIINQQ